MPEQLERGGGPVDTDAYKPIPFSVPFFFIARQLILLLYSMDSLPSPVVDLHRCRAVLLHSV